jgi:hypothetical protein
MIAYADVGHPEPPSSGESDIHPRRVRGFGATLSPPVAFDGTLSPPGAVVSRSRVRRAPGSSATTGPSADVDTAAVSDSCRSVGPGSMQLRPSGSAIAQAQPLGEYP